MSAPRPLYYIAMKQWRRAISLLLAVSIVTGLASMPGTAHAAGSGISLTTSPVSLDLMVQSGTSVTRTLLVMNNGTTPVKITMQLDEFSAKGTDGQAIITQPAPNDPSPGWVSFSPKSFIAQPSVWMPVKMTINLPKNAQLGYYYAAVFAPDIGTKAGNHTNVIKGSNGILVLVDTQSGNEKRTVDIASFTSSKKIYEYLPASFTVSVHNNGNIYLAPYGNIYISKSADSTHTIDVLKVNPNGGNVLPDSYRNFSATWSNGSPAFVNKTIAGQAVRDKSGQPVQRLSWDFSHGKKLRFGKYYAKLTLIYNNGKQTIPLTSTISFWVLPWKIIGGFIIVLAAIIAGLWFGRERIGRALKVLAGKA